MMFDPRSLRRKLGSLIPNDARKQIQNVLTVEWDTHKTVLVEVPGAPPVDTDVEMEGMGLNRKDEGYGRLDDDWDDHEDLMNPNLPIEPPRRQLYGSNASGSGSGSNSGQEQYDQPNQRSQPLRSYSQSSDKRLPPVPLANKEQDPFADDHDHYNDHASNSFLQPNRQPPKPARARTMEEGWNTFQNPESNDRSGSGNGNGNGKEGWNGKDIRIGVESPTSSRGTRDSAQTTEENPFR